MVNWKKKEKLKKSLTHLCLCEREWQNIVESCAFRITLEKDSELRRWGDMQPVQERKGSPHFADGDFKTGFDQADPHDAVSPSGWLSSVALHTPFKAEFVERFNLRIKWGEKTHAETVRIPYGQLGDIHLKCRLQFCSLTEQWIKLQMFRFPS